jgi:hypothetical protein
MLAASLARAVTVSPQPAAPGKPLIRPGALPAGEYNDPVLDPPIAFSIATGGVLTWRAALVTRSSLVLANDADGIEISLQHWTGIYPPASPTTGSQPQVVPVPADLVGWLTRHPALHLKGAPKTAGLAGHAARRLVFTVKPDRPVNGGPALGCTAQRDCVLLADTSDNPVAIPHDDTTEITAETGGSRSGLVLTVSIPTENYARDASEVHNLLSTMTAR